MLRRIARRHLPERPRLALALARRGWRDRATGDYRRLAQGKASGDHSSFRIADLSQPIRITGFVEGKLTNIRLGAERLDGAVIAPGEIFSFWALVGAPSARAGFDLGRSIRDGVVGGEVGGGLCQVSGIAYELLLRAGLAVDERHPHSRDLYSEAERFTPLGLDATVVWPYRDLRMANRLDVPVTLRFAVEEMTLRAALCAPRAVPPTEVKIERVDHPGRRHVRVSRDGILISDDSYATA
ncbi:MAG: VanW family protein [Pseudomonadota bacterium]